MIYNFIREADKAGALLLSGWKGFLYGKEQLVATQYPSEFEGALFKIPPSGSGNYFSEGRKLRNVNSYANKAVEYTISRYKVDKSIDTYKEPFEETLAYGIWQIIKIGIDDDIRDRLIVDSTIGNESGSLINHIQKVCQDPFVEFFQDTYKDQFFWIARKPPFTRKKVKEYVENDLLLNIAASEINTKYSNQVYSWYRINPQGIIAGTGSQVSWAYLKAVHFKEYSAIWGAKPLDIISNYIPHYPLTNKDSKLPTSYSIKQAIYDLQYLIEIHAYLPFTREGTIVIEGGDRRIKRGTWIYVPITEEIYYVDGVHIS